MEIGERLPARGAIENSGERFAPESKTRPFEVRDDAAPRLTIRDEREGGLQLRPGVVDDGLGGETHDSFEPRFLIGGGPGTKGGLVTAPENDGQIGCGEAN